MVKIICCCSFTSGRNPCAWLGYQFYTAKMSTFVSSASPNCWHHYPVFKPAIWKFSKPFIAMETTSFKGNVRERGPLYTSIIFLISFRRSRAFSLHPVPGKISEGQGAGATCPWCSSSLLWIYWKDCPAEITEVRDWRGRKGSRGENVTSSAPLQ